MLRENFGLIISYQFLRSDKLTQGSCWPRPDEKLGTDWKSNKAPIINIKSQHGQMFYKLCKNL